MYYFIFYIYYIVNIIDIYKNIFTIFSSLKMIRDKDVTKYKNGIEHQKDLQFTQSCLNIFTRWSQTFTGFKYRYSNQTIQPIEGPKAKQYINELKN
jgi:hypothetical protein